MKRLLIILICSILICSCTKEFIVYTNRGKFLVRDYHYGMGDISPLDVDSVRLYGDTTHTEYKYR